MGTIAVGAVLSTIGDILVIAFAATRWAPAAGDRWPLVVRLALLLLASNYAVAYGYF